VVPGDEVNSGIGHQLPKKERLRRAIREKSGCRRETDHPQVADSWKAFRGGTRTVHPTGMGLDAYALKEELSQNNKRESVLRGEREGGDPYARLGSPPEYRCTMILTRSSV